jgi:probable phosphoglycerate mutase
VLSVKHVEGDKHSGAYSAGVAQVYRQYRFNPPPGSTEILLVRHGESAPYREGDVVPLIDGHGDPPLSAEGHWQAERVGERLADEKIDAIYVSTLSRTAQTAAPLASRLGISPVVEPELREVFLGDWEGGVFRVHAAARHPAYVQSMAEERWELIPGAEADTAFGDRTRRALERIVKAHPDARVAMFVHGGVIGALLAHATRSRPFAFAGADNASISHLVVAGDRWMLRRFNDTGHLDELSPQAEPPI